MPEGFATGLSVEVVAVADPEWMPGPGGEQCKVTT